ncbi:MAG: chemotaxis protein CheB [Bryobacterales bacterium]
MADWAQSSTTDKPIRVLVVDDSVVIRRLVTLALREDPTFEVVGIAANGKIALHKIPQIQPDVVTLDIEMPEMDGLETLKRIKKDYPRIRVVMFSTLTQRGAHYTFEALTLGRRVRYESRERGSAGYLARLAARRAGAEDSSILSAPRKDGGASGDGSASAETRDAVADVPSGCWAHRHRGDRGLDGRPQRACRGFPVLPAGLRCPVVITQHMPPMFTRLLAERLDAKSPLRVFEAADGMEIEPASAYFAPGDHHLTVRRVPGKVVAKLNQDPPENSCRPAADVMFRSVAETYGGLLGRRADRDGARRPRRARILKQAGARVLAQDEASSVVWGMPGHVVQAGLADEIAPIGKIAGSIARFVGR